MAARAATPYRPAVWEHHAGAICDGRRHSHGHGVHRDQGRSRAVLIDHQPNAVVVPYRKDGPAIVKKVVSKFAAVNRRP